MLPIHVMYKVCNGFINADIGNVIKGSSNSWVGHSSVFCKLSEIFQQRVRQNKWNYIRIPVILLQRAFYMDSNWI